MSILDTCARAAYEKYFEGLIGDLEPAWDKCPEDYRDRLKDMHREFLRALRDNPDEGMVEAMRREEARFIDGSLASAGSVVFRIHECRDDGTTPIVFVTHDRAERDEKLSALNAQAVLRAAINYALEESEWRKPAAS